jgi:hypothetical protein
MSQKKQNSKLILALSVLMVIFLSYFLFDYFFRNPK